MEARTVDTLICGRWVIPVEPEVRALEDHAVAVDAGRIVEVLPVEAALQKYQARTTYDLTSHAVLPGFINVHTHAAMTLFRGLADDLPLMQWLNHHIWPAEQRWASPAFVADGTMLAALEMIRGGVTCFNDMYFFPDQTAEVAAGAGLRSVVGLILIDFPTPWAKDADEYFAKGVEVHDRFRNNPLVRTAFAPHSAYMVAEKSLVQVGTYAEELDLQIHMHLHEAPAEVEQSIEQHGKTPLARLEDLGLLGPRLIAVHMTQLGPEEIELAARYRINVAHCPESNLKLGNGFCPVQALLNANINVALGTDGAASNNDLDMLGEMRTAALIAKGIDSDPGALPARSALALATINSARAIGMDQQIGSLLPGKEADIIAIDLGAVETQPLFDPVSQIVYSASRSQVTHLWVAGNLLMDDREVLTVDTEAALVRAREWAVKIKA